MDDGVHERPAGEDLGGRRALWGRKSGIRPAERLRAIGHELQHEQREHRIEGGIRLPLTPLAEHFHPIVRGALQASGVLR